MHLSSFIYISMKKCFEVMEMNEYNKFKDVIYVEAKNVLYTRAALTEGDQLMRSPPVSLVSS